MLLLNGHPLNPEESHMRTYLMNALRGGHQQVVKELVNNKTSNKSFIDLCTCDIEMKTL